MSDATALLSALRDYSDTIDRHFAILRERHEQLTSVWGPTRDLYEGTGAEAFAEAMARANARFEEMIDTGSLIQSTLKAKLEELGRYDSPNLPEI
jgi:hypothetical protein